MRYFSILSTIFAVLVAFSAPISFAGDGKAQCKDKNCKEHKHECKDCKKKCNCKHKESKKGEEHEEHHE